MIISYRYMVMVLDQDNNDISDIKKMTDIHPIRDKLTESLSKLNILSDNIKKINLYSFQLNYYANQLQVGKKSRKNKTKHNNIINSFDEKIKKDTDIYSSIDDDIKMAKEYILTFIDLWSEMKDSSVNNNTRGEVENINKNILQNTILTKNNDAKIIRSTTKIELPKAMFDTLDIKNKEKMIGNSLIMLDINNHPR